MGWMQVASDAQGGKFLSTMTMDESGMLPGSDVNGVVASTDMNITSQEDLLFKRKVWSLSPQPSFFSKILCYIILALNYIICYFLVVLLFIYDVLIMSTNFSPCDIAWSNFYLLLLSYIFWYMTSCVFCACWIKQSLFLSCSCYPLKWWHMIN